MVVMVVKCPTCDSNSLRYHCKPAHKGCKWFVCRDCGGYGEPDNPNRWRGGKQ